MENKVDFAKISDNVTTLSGNVLDLKLAIEGIGDLLNDVTPKDEESRKQLANVNALLIGLNMMASNASKVACELEKDVPLANDGDKNTK